MFEDRDVRSDVFALGLLVLVIFLALSLVSYSSTDPIVELIYPFNQFYQPDIVSYPLSETTANFCGPWGALVASMMLDALGIGAYYAVGSLGVITVLLLMRHEVDSPVVRMIGWILSLVAVTTLADMLTPWLNLGPVVGSGGYLGLLGSGLLRMHFAEIGGLLIALSVLVGGLLLCTDYVLVHLGLVLGSLTMASVWGVRGFLGYAADEADEDSIDDEEEDEYEEDEEDAGPVAIRVRGKKLLTDVEGGEADEEVADEEYEDEEAYDDDEEDEQEELDEELEDDEVDEELEDDEVDEEPAISRMAAVAGAVTTAASSLVRSSRGGGRRRIAPLRIRKAPDPEEREEVMSQLDEASIREDDGDYELPSTDLLVEQDDFCYDEQAKEVRRKAKILEKTFESFGFDVKVVEIETGPVIAQYEVELEAGLRLSKITGLADDLAIALRVPSVRIVAPIPGKNTVGIEVPNEQRQLVRLGEVMKETNGKLKKMRIPLFLGKDVAGNALTADLSALPHLLIAGRTGTGKSVCLNAIITSILMTRRPDEVRMLMIDPKMVELSGYKSLPHLMHPVVTDMRKAEAILAWAVEKMEERYELLARAGVRHVSVFNQLSESEIMQRVEPESDEERRAIPLHMPYIVIVADEIADLMMTAGKEVEQHIIRLAQKSRAVGIHLILATQKPTVDVITGLIKSNLPARISFQVASRTDSRVVLDEMGADKLLGNGDMLFLWPGTSTLLRGQGTFVSDDEINAVVEAASTGEQNFVKELVQLKVDDGEAKSTGQLKKRDDLYEAAVETVIIEGRGSVSLLQRAHGIGYGRAARLIDFMAEDGIVGPYAGSQAREVAMSMSEWEQLKNGGGDGTQLAVDEAAEPIAPSKTRGKKRKKLLAMPAPNHDEETPDDDEDLSSDVTPDEAESTAAELHEDDPVEQVDDVEEDDEEEEVDDVDDVEDEAEAEAEDEGEEESAEDEEDVEYEYVYEDAEGDDEEEYEYVDDEGDEGDEDEEGKEGEEYAEGDDEYDDDEYEYVYEEDEGDEEDKTETQYEESA